MKRFVSLILLICFIAVKGWGQEVKVDAKIDSLQILVGQQTKIRLQVAMDAAQKAVLPTFNDTIVKGVEVVHQAVPDTQMLNNGKRMVLTKMYTVTSFDSALYYIPPIEVLVNNKVYKSKSMALKVYSIPVDTLHPDQYYPQKNVQNPPFVWADWYASMACALMVIPLIVLIVMLIIRIRDNKPIIRIIKMEKKLPAHEQAMREMEKIKQDKIWKQGLTKDYYTQLTDVIRNYINQRFGFNAMEMTSSEIIEKLKELHKTEDLSGLNELFATADLVKFAKYSPMLNENDSNLITAIGYINDTKLVEEETQKQPEEVKVIEKRPLRIKIILYTLAGAASVALISCIIYIIRDIYTYFF